VTRFLRWGLPPVAVAFLALLAFGLTRSPQNLPSALIDLPAPEFHLPIMSEPADSISLEALRGRVVVLNYWASWCFPCVQEHPYLLKLDHDYDAADVQVLGMLYQDEPEKGRAFVAEYGGDWPTLVDPGSSTAIPYGVYGPPETFVISPDGVIAFKLVGPLTPRSYPIVTAAIDSLLAIRGPAPPTEDLETATLADSVGSNP
jgi:cytochrome c biogenesis protein CcmG/thiol:disulfide interchange protein DsbE